MNNETVLRDPHQPVLNLTRRNFGNVTKTTAAVGNAHLLHLTLNSRLNPEITKHAFEIPTLERLGTGRMNMLL